jgi:hypothetical protein
MRSVGTFHGVSLLLLRTLWGTPETNRSSEVERINHLSALSDLNVARFGKFNPNHPNFGHQRSPLLPSQFSGNLRWANRFLQLTGPDFD